MRRLVGRSGFLAGQDGDIEVRIALEGFYDRGAEHSRSLEGVRIHFLLENITRKQREFNSHRRR